MWKAGLSHSSPGPAPSPAADGSQPNPLWKLARGAGSCFPPVVSFTQGQPQASGRPRLTLPHPGRPLRGSPTQSSAQEQQGLMQGHWGSASPSPSPTLPTSSQEHLLRVPCKPSVILSSVFRELSQRQRFLPFRSFFCSLSLLGLWGGCYSLFPGAMVTLQRADCTESCEWPLLSWPPLPTMFIPLTSEMQRLSAPSRSQTL